MSAKVRAAGFASAVAVPHPAVDDDRGCATDAAESRIRLNRSAARVRAGGFVTGLTSSAEYHYGARFYMALNIAARPLT
jgi:hypothetical protein